MNHYKTVHHKLILKCHKCGKEFIHEKDRLHHVREEHEKAMDARVHKSEHKQKGTGNPQDQVDSNMKNFGDNPSFSFVFVCKLLFTSNKKNTLKCQYL